MSDLKSKVSVLWNRDKDVGFGEKRVDVTECTNQAFF